MTTKLFRALVAATYLSIPASCPRRFNVFKGIAPRVDVVGAGKPDLERLTVKELRRLATSMKIKGRTKARRKADLITLIRRAS